MRLERGWSPCSKTTAQGIRFWTIGLTTCQGHSFSYREFFGVVGYRFRVIVLLTPKVERICRNRVKNRYGGKRENFKISLQSDSFNINLRWPSFAEIGKAKVTKPMRGISHEKALVFGRFLRRHATISPKFFVGLHYSFPTPIPLPTFVKNPSRFPGGRYMRKCLPDILQYRREACKGSRRQWLPWLALNYSLYCISFDCILLELVIACLLHWFWSRTVLFVLLRAQSSRGPAH